MRKTIIIGYFIPIHGLAIKSMIRFPAMPFKLKMQKLSADTVFAKIKLHHQHLRLKL